MATITPPRAGPVARAMLKATPFKATAAGNSGRGTSSGMTACQTGMFMADPRPSANVKESSAHGVVAPVSVSTLKPAAAAHIQAWVKRSMPRRSIMSAKAPEGKTTRNTGRLVAVCIRATMTGDDVREVISHTPPTFCIHVPTLETMAAVHNARKIG